MTTIEKYIISAINSIKSKKQRADESSISEYILKKFEANVSKSDIVERIEILLKKKKLLSINNLMAKPHTKSMKKKLLTMRLQMTLIIILITLLTLMLTTI